jgi:hypothetical protein
MPLNGRRGSSKIVVPVVPNRNKELVGGLRNALERGETLEKAKQSFTNAGYNSGEIGMAAQMISTTPDQIKGQQIPPPLSSSNSQVPANSTPASTNTTTTTPEQPKKSSKTLIIILIVISAMFLTGAAVLGIFWDKIF